MRLLFALIVVCLLYTSALAEHNRLTPEQVKEGWISLFDGETLFGWQPINNIDWQVADGEIRATKGDIGYLMTTSQFSDYELHVEFKADPETNSGIFLRTPLRPKDPKTDCYELNIAPLSNPFPTASIVGRFKFPDDITDENVPWTAYPPNPNIIEEEQSEQNNHKDEWISFDVVAQGGKITIFYSGHAIYEYTDSNPILRGHIGLQHNQGPIAFRNVRLKPLGSKSIFNGKDLTGWNTDRAEASRFEVTDAGELRVLDGRGQLESNDSYGDFLLQLECFVNGDALNSGVFFRCIPGDFMMGYECQIHNGMQDGDPTKPVDCGTGGIFRRQDARRIVAKDREWFALTLVADGPHMAAWVNGQQVSDWTDQRKPDENPRRGLRVEPGTLAIQGHDPTTDLRFRNLQIVEMPRGE